MSDLSDDDAKALKFAAQVAVKILELAEDGTKLFTIHRHYPKGFDAVSYGFGFGFGFSFSVCAVYAIGLAVARIIGAA